MLFDVNNHPFQNKVNEELGHLLADTIKKLHYICDKYKLEASSTAVQYRDVFNKLMDNEFKKGDNNEKY